MHCQLIDLGEACPGEVCTEAKGGWVGATLAEVELWRAHAPAWTAARTRARAGTTSARARAATWAGATSRAGAATGAGATSRAGAATGSRPAKESEWLA